MPSVDVKRLAALCEAPPLFEPGDASIWTDPRMGSAMLDTHLDPSIEFYPLVGNHDYHRYDNGSTLVDTGPELRLQALAQDMRQVDAICLTHHHADHVVGLDDVRRFNWLRGGAIPVYGNAFRDDPDYPSSKPNLLPRVVEGPFEVGGREVIPIPLLHGRMPILGYRVGNIAYCTDCSEIPEASRRLLRGLDVLVLDALRRQPHPRRTKHGEWRQGWMWTRSRGGSGSGRKGS